MLSCHRLMALTEEYDGCVPPCRKSRLTSYDNLTVGSGSIVNDLAFVYSDFGQLVTEYQQHGGAVNTGTSHKVHWLCQCYGMVYVSHSRCGLNAVRGSIGASATWRSSAVPTASSPEATPLREIMPWPPGGRSVSPSVPRNLNPPPAPAETASPPKNCTNVPFPS